MADISRGNVIPQLILCVLALAARFSHHKYYLDTPPRLRGSKYAREAARLLDLHEASIATVQAAVLLGAFYGTEGDSLRENIYYSVACRIGCLLHLPECLSNTPLHRETGIRLWWTLDMIDSWSSNSLRLPRLLIPRNDVPYPISDETFLRMRRTTGATSDRTPSTIEEISGSILTQKIKLSTLLPEIIQLNRSYIDDLSNRYVDQMATVNLARRLKDWHDGLPDHLVDNTENLAAQAALGSGGAFVALHIGFYHFSQLLYYRYLHQSVLADVVTDTDPEDVRLYAARCRDSSIALCELLYAALMLPGAEVYYSMVGHALVISSTVQLHVLLFSDNEESVEAARTRLGQNYVILCSLQSLWQTIDHTFERFRAFHQACMRVTSQSDIRHSPFRLDKWMLRFLLEYAQPVTKLEDRPVDNELVGLYDESELAPDGDAEHEMLRTILLELGVSLEGGQSWDYVASIENFRSRRQSLQVGGLVQTHVNW